MADIKYQRIPFNKLIPFAYPTIPEEDDINSSEEDIHRQKLQNLATITYLGLFICLSYNAIAVMTRTFITGEDTTSCFLSLAYYFCGLPAAYFSWYKPLIHALSTDSTTSLRRFLTSFYFHTGFCIFAAVAPPMFPNKGRSLTGILSGIDVLDEDSLVGYLYITGFAWFVFESFLSLYLMQKVSSYYRRNGLDLEMV